MAALYVARDRGADADRVAIVFHRNGSAIDVELPAPRDGFCWRRALDTAAPLQDSGAETGGRARIEARSVVVFVEKENSACLAPARRSVDERDLARLAEAAGIAREWWDVDGTRHT